MKKKKCAIIICGGVIEEDFVLEAMKNSNADCIIAVDKGLEFLHQHKIKPGIIVGDFDSVRGDIVSQYLNREDISVYPHDSMKESSDTELAIEVALNLNLKYLLILGATGNRLDHFWGNVQSLTMTLEAGVSGVILDGRNRIRLLNKDFTIRKGDCFGDYFSLFPLGGIVENISLQGARYPLTNEKLTPWNSRCISNEIIEEELVISFNDGVVVLMETKD